MRWAAAGLLVLTIVRLWIACVVPLAPDEAYYWTWSRALQAGYLDHPPMVAVWIRIGTAVAGDTALGVRLLGPLCAVLGSVLIYDSAARLFPRRRAGLIAAVLLNATLGFGAGAVIMTPDTPLLFFWIVTLWAGARLAAGGTVAWWYVAGFGAGLAVLSKYTAVMLPVGLGIWALWARPRDARRAAPWLAAGVMVLLFLPVVLWNADHAWASFLKQGGRAADWRPERAAGFLAELVFGQIGLVTPGIFVLFVMGVAGAVAAIMRRLRAGGERAGGERAGAALAVALTLPGALVFLQHAIGDRVQGNWPAILYPGAALAAAGCASARARIWIWPSAALGFAVTALVYLYAGLGWAALPAARDPVARQLWGWADLAERVEAARRDAGAGFVAAEPFGLAAELAWSHPASVSAGILAAGRRWDTFKLPRAARPGPGLLIRPARYGERLDRELWGETRRLTVIARPGGGEDYAVFLITRDARMGDGVWLTGRR